MKLFAIVDILGDDPESSNDIFVSRLDAEQEIKKRDCSCDLVEIEIKKRDDLLLIRKHLQLEFDESGCSANCQLDFICSCTDKVYRNRQLCEVCGEWAGGPPEGEE